MNEQNSVLNIIGKVSGFLSKYIAVVILITSAVAFTHTQKFMWIPQYTALPGHGNVRHGPDHQARGLPNRLFPT